MIFFLVYNYPTDIDTFYTSKSVKILQIAVTVHHPSNTSQLDNISEHIYRFLQVTTLHGCRRQISIVTSTKVDLSLL